MVARQTKKQGERERKKEREKQKLKDRKGQRGENKKQNVLKKRSFTVRDTSRDKLRKGGYMQVNKDRVTEAKHEGLNTKKKRKEQRNMQLKYIETRREIKKMLSR